jgi:hypothetical protein
MHSRVLIGLAALLLAGSPAAKAHDTWVRPVALRPAPAQPLPVELSAGHGLQPLSTPRRRRIGHLSLAGLRRQQRVLGWQRRGRRIVASLGPVPCGVGCIALRTRATLIEIDAAGVDGYLAEVQPPAPVMAAWLAQRARGEPWREWYAKDAKSYFRAGRGGPSWRRLQCLGRPAQTADTAQPAHPARHAPARCASPVLELLPLRDPTRLRPGATLPVQLLHEGRPLPDTALRLFDRQGERIVRTDAAGRATWRVRCRGHQLVATTVLKLPRAAGAPWTSRFATLAYTVAPR